MMRKRFPTPSIGDRINNWVVKASRKKGEVRNKHTEYLAVCSCQYATEHWFDSSAQLHASPRCQACTHATHGESKTVEYRTWLHMQQRCNEAKKIPCDPKYTSWINVTVHPSWLGPGGFKVFLAEVGRRPAGKTSIDRYPNKRGNYEPGNVRWGDPQEQSTNQVSNVELTYRGSTYCLEVWSRIVGIDSTTLRHRLRNGLAPVDILFLPSNRQRQIFHYLRPLLDAVREGDYPELHHLLPENSGPRIPQ